MNIRKYNRTAWDREVDRGNKRTVPVSEAVIAAARQGQWEILLTPSPCDLADNGFIPNRYILNYKITVEFTRRRACPIRYSVFDLPSLTGSHVIWGPD